MSITTVHPQYAAKVKRWEKNRDFMSGEEAVKAKGRIYLPDDNAKVANGVPQNESKVGPPEDPYKYVLRYHNYLNRASLLAFAQYTKNTLVGMVFNEDPKIELPPNLEYLKENVDGGGQSLIQFGKFAVSEALETARLGILADMPAVDRELSGAEEAAMFLRPRLLPYVAEVITDWVEDTTGAAVYPSFIKLREEYNDREDPLDDYRDVEVRYRILRLEIMDGYDYPVYTQEVVDDSGVVLVEKVIPKRSTGVGKEPKPFKRIQFFFAGAENNKPDVDDSPMSAIVDINASHYRNSADNEQLNHLYAKPTLHMDMGDNSRAEEFKENNPNGVSIGEGLVTGGGGTATLLQIQANGSLDTLMKSKEDQARSIGAEIQSKDNDKNVTAEAARIKAAGKAASLTTVTGNVSEAIEAALQSCAMFMNEDETKVQFELNTAFYGQDIDAESIRVIMDLYDRGQLTQKQFEAALAKFGLDVGEV